MGKIYTTTGISLTDTSGGTFIAGAGIQGSAAFESYNYEAADWVVSTAGFGSDLGYGTMTIVANNPLRVIDALRVRGTVPSGNVIEVQPQTSFNGGAYANYSFNSFLLSGTPSVNTQAVRPWTLSAGTHDFILTSRITGGGTATISPVFYIINLGK